MSEALKLALCPCCDGETTYARGETVVHISGPCPFDGHYKNAEAWMKRVRDRLDSRKEAYRRPSEPPEPEGEWADIDERSRLLSESHLGCIEQDLAPDPEWLDEFHLSLARSFQAAYLAGQRATGGGWVSVETETPKITKDYNVVRRRGDGLTWVSTLQWTGASWMQGLHEALNVTHWQPLPEPSND